MFVNRYLFVNVFHINSGCVFSLEIPYFDIFFTARACSLKGKPFLLYRPILCGKKRMTVKDCLLHS